MKNPLEFTDKARYIGSLPKAGQMCDFYEIEMDGTIRYIFIAAEPPLGEPRK